MNEKVEREKHKKAIGLVSIMSAYFHKQLRNSYVWEIGTPEQLLTDHLKKYCMGSSDIIPDIILLHLNGNITALRSVLRTVRTDPLIFSDTPLDIEKHKLVVSMLPKEEGCDPCNPYFIFRKKPS